MKMKTWDFYETWGTDVLLVSPLGMVSLGENKEALKSCQGLNLAWLCSSLVILAIEDSALWGFSVVQCLRKAAVVLPGRQKHRSSLKQHKRKNAFSEHSVKLHRLLCMILWGPIKQVFHRQHLTSFLSAITNTNTKLTSSSFHGV